ncbi:DUF6304 family protein [Tenacibaculum mesophilum]|uniref:Uncharacterized protein n=1 Tax=Tenacibaculum mesophilum TaxID=104268 RepID=A0ABM7CI64_9FLAO|nr:DUF6304 family protein [Tenacibaculum mesophilum]AZJ33483.1 hypothetical protein D6200_13280 [Tenacibaculum mesophilum]
MDINNRLMRQYKATYQDKRGTEKIIIKSNGSVLFSTIRGIDFYGGDFDQLTTNSIDNTKFDYNMFADGSGDITNFSLKIIFLIQFFNATTNQTVTEHLIVTVVVGEHATIDSLDHEINSLTLNASFGKFIVENKLEWMEEALIALQNQLPPNIYLKTCLSCKFSNYHPVGNGIFGSLCCFKNYKKQLKQIQSKFDLLDLWTEERIKANKLFFVQETFDCKEHQIPTKADWFYKNWTKTI